MHTLKNIYFCISILAINAAQAQTRTWTNIENNKIKAEYLSHSQSKVTFKLSKSGKITEYPIEKLSTEDRIFLTELKNDTPSKQIDKNKANQQNTTKGLRIIDEIEYKVKVLTTMQIPSNNSKIEQIRVWHALPSVRPWSNNTEAVGATEITYSKGGKQEFNEAKKSHHHYWSISGIQKEDTQYSFETTFTVKSATRIFEPDKVTVKWSDYKNDPVANNYQKSIANSPPVLESIVDIAEKISANKQPAEAVQEFCVWVKKNIKYDASVHYSSIDSASTMKNRKGHCGHQSLILKELCRHSKIPYRTVFGMNLYDQDGRGSLHRIRRDYTNIHTWAEVYFPSVGWIEIEPSGGNKAYTLPARMIQNNPWFQNYSIRIKNNGKQQVIPWVYKAGRYTSPYNLELLITFTSSKK